MKTFIKIFLTNRNLRQIEIAHQLGIDGSLFNKYVNGWAKLPKKYVPILSKILNLSEKTILENKVIK